MANNIGEVEQEPSERAPGAKPPAPIAALGAGTTLLLCCLLLAAAWGPLSNQIWDQSVFRWLLPAGATVVLGSYWLMRRGFRDAAFALCHFPAVAIGMIYAFKPAHEQAAWDIRLLMIAGLVALSLLALVQRWRYALPLLVIALGLALGPMLDIGRALLYRTWDIGRSDMPRLLGIAIDISMLKSYVCAAVVFAVTATIAVNMAVRIAGSEPSREWLRLKSAGAHGFGTKLSSDFRRNREMFRVCVLAGAIFLLWPVLGYIPVALMDVEPIARYVDVDWVHEIFSHRWFFITLPMLLAIGVFAWHIGERLVVSPIGVRLFLFDNRLTLFSAPWSRIKVVDMIRHRQQPPEFVFHYHSRFGIPFSLGVHVRRYADPALLTETLENEIERNRVPLRSWLAPESKVVAAWLLLIVGGLLCRGIEFHSGWIMREIALERMPWERMKDASGVLSLPLLSISAVAAFGLGLGLMSAHHRGGARPLLMSLWMLATLVLPSTAIIHWLVWIAMYSILTARLSPVDPHPWIPAPTGIEWQLGFALYGLIPLVAGLSYLLGVTIGRRPMKATTDAGRFMQEGGITERMYRETTSTTA